MKQTAESAIRDELLRLDIAGFVARQRFIGRSDLPEALRQEWAPRHEFAAAILNSQQYGRQTREAARLLFEVTYFIGTVPPDVRPNYCQYTDSRLLDWYLEPESGNVERAIQRTLDGICIMLNELVTFERRSLDGLEPAHKDDFDPIIVSNRLELAEQTLSHVRGLGAVLPDSEERKPPRTLREVIHSSRAAAVAHLMCVPVSRAHDEVLFIRALQGGELCFFGIRVAVSAAIEAIKAEKPQIALGDILGARKFARILHEFLKVLRTMPVQHFATFRALTGGASAIQSIGYHLMDTLLRGVNTDKLEHFTKNPLRPIARFTDRRFMSLRQALSNTSEADPEWSSVWSASKQLDRDLLTWRGFHVSLAKLYLGDDPGSGGTAGAAYLKEHLFRGIFDDVEPDWNAVRDLFPEVEPLGSSRVKPGQLVAP
jgi:tryptophan 2,3-dioxygenase